MSGPGGERGVDHDTLLALWFSGLLCGARVLTETELLVLL